MFSLLALLGVAATAGIVSTIVVTRRDGYGRRPKETFARTV